MKPKKITLRKNKLKKIIQKTEWTLKGFILGLTSLLPGLSFGTLAFIMGIYEKCIFSITNLIVLKKTKKDDMSFLFFLILGVLLALLLFTKIISELLNHFPLEVYSIFTGLIVASFPKLFKLTDKKVSSFLLLFLTALSFFIFFKMIPSPSHTLNSNFRLFISGFLSFFVAILPGLSGSMVLLLMGTYHFILSALTEWIIKYILIFLAGGALGLTLSFYFTRFFLKKRKSLFFCLAIGFIIGSLPEVIPYEKILSEEKSFRGFLKFIGFTFIGASSLFFIEKTSSSLKKKLL